MRDDAHTDTVESAQGGLPIFSKNSRNLGRGGNVTQTIISALLVFISTSIDYVIILTILFSMSRTRKSIGHVVGGLYLGTAFLVTASLVAAFALNYVPEDWMIGFLGLIPLILGIRVAIKGGKEEKEEEEGEENEIVEKLESRKSTQLFWTIALITIASGGDNLGIYIPYFATLSGSEIAIMLLVFVISTAALSFLGKKLSTIPLISQTLEKYERIIVPVVYIALGIFIMLESRTFAKIFELIGA
jgi:cadmium resistance transport/sequestration family protein